MGDTKSIRSYRSSRSSRIKIRSKSSSDEAADLTDFIHQNGQKFQIIFLEIKLLDGNYYEKFSSEYLRNFYTSVDFQAVDIEEIIVKLKTHLAKHEIKDEVVLFVISGPIKVSTIRTFLEKQFPIQMVVQISFDQVTNEEIKALKAEQSTENTTFLEQVISVNPNELWDEEQEIYNAFISFLIMNLINFNEHHENYLSTVEIVEPLEVEPIIEDKETELVFMELVEKVVSVDKSWKEEIKNFKEIPINFLEEDTETMPGLLSKRDFFEVHEQHLKSWIEMEIEQLKFLVEKAECKSHISTPSIVSFIMHEIFHDPVKKLFSEFQMPTIVPNLAYPVEKGKSITFKTDIKTVNTNIGTLGVVRTFGTHPENVNIVCESKASKIKIFTDIPRENKVCSVAFYNAISRVSCEWHRKSAQTEIPRKIMSRKSVTIGKKDVSDTKSIRSRKSILKTRSSMLKSILTISEEHIDDTMCIFIENCFGAVVSINESLQQRLEYNNVIYIEGCVVMYHELELQIFTYNGATFDIKIHDDNENTTKNESVASSKYMFELNFLKTLLRNSALLNVISKNLKTAVINEMIYIQLTASDGFQYSLQNENLMYIQRFYCWDSFDYFTGTLTIVRDDGITLFFDTDKLICTYGNGLIFTTKLSDVLAYGDLELYEEVEGIIDQVVNFSTQSQHFWKVNKEITIENNQWCKICWKEMNNEPIGCHTSKYLFQVETDGILVEFDELKTYFKVLDATLELILDTVKRSICMKSRDREETNVIVHLDESSGSLVHAKDAHISFRCSWNLEVVENITKRIVMTCSSVESDNETISDEKDEKPLEEIKSKDDNFQDHMPCFPDIMNDIRERNERLKAYLTLVGLQDFKAIKYWDFLDYNSSIAEFPNETLNKFIRE